MARRVLFPRVLMEDTGFEDAATTIEVRDEQFSDQPPPLPVALTQRKTTQENWLSQLPDAAEGVLRSAERTAPDYRLIGRLPGAVAIPVSGAQ